LAAYLNAGWLLLLLIKQQIYRPIGQWWRFLLRVILANAAMGFFLYRFTEADLWLTWNLSQRSLQLALMIVLAMLVYAVALLLLGFRPRQLGQHPS
jgi:putative peptidoglycan lipid II flippase